MQSSRLDGLKALQRRTRRATVSLPEQVLSDLVELSDEQGRSLSNFMAFLLETKLREIKAQQMNHQR